MQHSQKKSKIKERRNCCEKLLLSEIEFGRQRRNKPRKMGKLAKFRRRVLPVWLIFFLLFLHSAVIFLFSPLPVFAEEAEKITVSREKSPVPWFYETYKEKKIKEESSVKRVINFIPAVNHFYSGQWRKGISDIWNIVMLAFGDWHTGTDLNKLNENIRTSPATSRTYAEAKNKIRQFEDLKTGWGMMILMNYINSVVDAFTSDNDNGFLGAYYAYDIFHYSGFAEDRFGIVPGEAVRQGSYWGFTFGYRNIFEYSSDMMSPTILISSTSIFSMNWYSDFIVPYKFHKNLDLYAGLGFNQIEYHDENAQISTGGCGLGFYPRIGVSYLFKERHYFRLTYAPWLLWGNVKFSDPEKTGTEGKSGGHERTISRDWGDNYGFQFIYGLKLFRQLYLKTNITVSKVAEAGGDFIEGSTVFHLDKHFSYMQSLDLSINYAF